MNVATNLEWSAFFFPQQPAMGEGSSETSYAQFNEKANRVATALMNLGVKPGDHVALCAPNSGDWLIVYFGVLKAGAVAVALSSMLSKDELALLVNHSQPRLIYTEDERLDALARFKGSGGLENIISPHGDLDLQQLMEKGSPAFKAIERGRSDTAAILYTGGTTGTPKGVMLTHENINTSAHNVAFSERSTEADRALCFLPFNHVFGQMHIMNATILSGGCLEILPAFDLDQVLNILAAGRATKLFAVPTVYVRLLGVEGLKE
jgi:long-chain acyl-CoA synthetase